MLKIQGNLITNCYRGIYLWDSTNNIIKKNSVTYGTTAMAIIDSDNNIIGPKNVMSENNAYGIGLVDSSNNDIFNNTALNNGTCDIIDFTGNSNNSLKNNTADCVEGFD